MNRNAKQITQFVLLISLLVFSACKKEEKEVVPDYHQFLGGWYGSTSQNAEVFFHVDYLGGTLYITSYKIKVLFSSGYQEYQMTKSDGIVAVSSQTFRISLGTGNGGPAYIDGLFSTNDLLLNGKFAVYQDGNKNDLVTGIYNAYQQSH